MKYLPIEVTPIGRVTYEEFEYLRGLVHAELDAEVFRTRLWMYQFLVERNVVPRYAMMMVAAMRPITKETHSGEDGFFENEVIIYQSYLERLEKIAEMRKALDEPRPFAKPEDQYRLEFPTPKKKQKKNNTESHKSEVP